MTPLAGTGPEGTRIRGQVRSWWLNALVITTVLWMWASLATALWIGYEIVHDSSSTNASDSTSLTDNRPSLYDTDPRCVWYESLGEWHEGGAGGPLCNLNP
jgi:hypothetical protein